MSRLFQRFNLLKLAQHRSQMMNIRSYCGFLCYFFSSTLFPFFFFTCVIFLLTYSFLFLHDSRSDQLSSANEDVESAIRHAEEEMDGDGFARPLPLPSLQFLLLPRTLSMCLFFSFAFARFPFLLAYVGVEIDRFSYFSHVLAMREIIREEEELEAEFAEDVEAIVVGDGSSVDVSSLSNMFDADRPGESHVEVVQSVYSLPDQNSSFENVFFESFIFHSVCLCFE